MAKKKKPRSKVSLHKKRAALLLKGVTTEFNVIDPLNDLSAVTNHRRWHKNYLLRGHVNAISRDLPVLMEKMRLLYHVACEMEFVDSYGKKYYRAVEIAIDGFFHKEKEHMMAAIEDVFRESNMDHYITTKITIEIKGTGSAKSVFKD